jgi:RNA polymerase sigma factor (sigma-70 family)
LTTDDLLAEPLLGADLNTFEYAAEMDLRQALGQLPEQLRLIVVLRYFVDMDASEIGLVLRLPSAAVRTRLRRALARLRSGLKQKEGRPLVTIEDEGS